MDNKENILTIDVEDWESAISGIYGKILPSSENVYKNTIELLSILNYFNAKGTFFFLGEVAEKFPALLKEVIKSGNEIGCHSYYHLELHKIPFNELKENIKKAKDLIEQIIGRKIIGFRAPNFSLMKCKPNVFDLLLDLGFKYDSSLFPYKKYNSFKIQLEPFFYKTPQGRKIFEIPLSVFSFIGLKIPCLGGAFLRNYPFFLSKYFFKKILKEGRKIVFYLHPHEFEKINFENLNLNLFRKYFEKKGRNKAKNYLFFLFKKYKFNSIENFYFTHPIAPSQITFPLPYP